MTLIEPGMVETPFFENRLDRARCAAEDIADAVMYAVAAAHVDVNEILVRPTRQPADGDDASCLQGSACKTGVLG